MAKVAVLHTSFVFVTVEPVITDLISELIPGAELLHFVDSDVLATVVREQGISERSELRMVHLAQAAEAAGADVIFSACSSLGPTLDAAQRAVGVPVVKIDQAMATIAARSDRIGVLATVPTTLGPTSDLIASVAAGSGRSPHIVQRLCPGAFDVLMAGDRVAHDQMIADQAAELAGEVDVIVLAQASMNRLVERLEAETGLPVLSSPRSGVENLARIVREVSHHGSPMN
ncbi:Asp/Glu/hydantoin racemase [Nakamurella sp. UYEF19]|uniref:aspartate/glutamate racemase family protein n=1 Tax=Nakamurella sp. UYEF19 TaxID=1756392 RepID=UPI003395BC32